MSEPKAPTCSSMQSSTMSEPKAHTCSFPQSSTLSEPKAPTCFLSSCPSITSYSYCPCAATLVFSSRCYRTRLGCTGCILAANSMSSKRKNELVFKCAACDDLAEQNRCIAYVYTNRSSGITAMMYECDGALAYQSLGSISKFHGIVERDDAHRMVLHFNCTGNVNKLKAHVLHRVGNDSWEGFDSRGQDIALEWRRTFTWCTACDCWH